jgi:gliding motility-associated-like protein
VDGFLGSSFAWSVDGGVITTERNDSVFVDWGTSVGDYQISVTETSSAGCESSPVILDVHVTAPTIDLGFDRFICEGETAIITPTGSFTSLIWQDGSTGATYVSNTNELISITVFDDNLCPGSDSVQVTVMATPVINLGRDTILCGAQSLVLDAGNPGSYYEWSTGETSQSITVYSGSQEIWVSVTSEFGCQGGDTIRLYRCSISDYFSNIPNAFTPNEDNVNDTWYFDEAAAFPNILVEIYDRWGMLVFRSGRGYSEPWDGRNMNGKEMPMDSYYYVIDPGDGSKQIEGTVTIIR